MEERVAQQSGTQFVPLDFESPWNTCTHSNTKMSINDNNGFNRRTKVQNNDLGHFFPSNTQVNPNQSSGITLAIYICTFSLSNLEKG